MKHVRRSLQQNFAIDEIALDREPTFGLGAKARHELALDLDGGTPVRRFYLDTGKAAGDLCRRREITTARSNRCV
jgi:hypothetical protein